MATNKMMLVNLKEYTHHVLSTTSHHSPFPMLIINKSRYCPTNKRQIITCSSSKVHRFVITNARASKEIMLLSTAQQPYSTTPFHSTADHQRFDPSCDDLLVVVENILEHAAHMVDTALLEYLEKLEEKLSKANVFIPLLCTIKQQLLTNTDKVVVLSETVPKEIVKAFRELILADDNLRPSLTEAYPNKLMQEDPNASPMIQLWGMNAFTFFHPRDKKPQIPWSLPRKDQMFPDYGIGPNATSKYTFYYGSKNEEWIKEFVTKATVVANDSCIKATNISIEVCCILDPKIREEVQHLSKIVGTRKEDSHFLRHFESRSDGRFVLTYNQSKVLLHDGGRTILKVLEEFHEQWKNNVPLIGFEHSFMAYYHGQFHTMTSHIDILVDRCRRRYQERMKYQNGC